jgi:glutamate dehydrogenase (NAD(P)+)
VKTFWPDVGTGEREMARWPAYTLSIGGIDNLVRDRQAGGGEFMKARGDRSSSIRYPRSICNRRREETRPPDRPRRQDTVIQGFGNVGYYAAKFLSEEDGCKVIGCQEWDAALYNPNGIAVEASMTSQGHRIHKELSGAQTLSGPDAIWDVKCDILIPAALENQITLENCDRINCKVLAEAANGPTTPGAEDRLHGRGVFIIPDIYLNAGGVTVSYFEWGKNLSHMRFGRLQKHLEEIKNGKLVSTIEKMMGKPIPEQDKKYLVRGPDDRSGQLRPEESMVEAYQEIRDVHHSRVQGRHADCGMVLRSKVALSYEQLGIFP